MRRYGNRIKIESTVGQGFYWVVDEVSLLALGSSADLSELFQAELDKNSNIKAYGEYGTFQIYNIPASQIAYWFEFTFYGEV